MRCASCNHYFDDSDRTRRELNATGRFVVQNPRAAKENVGFHWNALCTMSWGALAELYLRAKAIAPLELSTPPLALASPVCVIF